MFTDILKMWGFFFQTELILRSNKTQLSSIEINKFMTQVNNCMFIFSEIKCDVQAKVVKFVTKTNSVKVIFKNYLVFSMYP